MTAVAVAAALAGAALLVMAPLADAKPQRSAVAEFRRSTPCPATGLTGGACAGYVVGPIAPACAGVAEAADLQWRTVVDAKAHEGWTREYCRFHRVRARSEGGLS